MVDLAAATQVWVDSVQAKHAIDNQSVELVAYYAAGHFYILGPGGEEIAKAYVGGVPLGPFSVRSLNRGPDGITAVFECERQFSSSPTKAPIDSNVAFTQTPSELDQARLCRSPFGSPMQVGSWSFGDPTFHCGGLYQQPVAFQVVRQFYPGARVVVSPPQGVGPDASRGRPGADVPDSAPPNLANPQPTGSLNAGPSSTEHAYVVSSATEIVSTSSSIKQSAGPKLAMPHSPQGGRITDGTSGAVTSHAGVYTPRNPGDLPEVTLLAEPQIAHVSHRPQLATNSEESSVVSETEADTSLAPAVDRFSDACRQVIVTVKNLLDFLDAARENPEVSPGSGRSNVQRVNSYAQVGSSNLPRLPLQTRAASLRFDRSPRIGVVPSPTAITLRPLLPAGAITGSTTSDLEAALKLVISLTELVLEDHHDASGQARLKPGLSTRVARLGWTARIALIQLQTLGKIDAEAALSFQRAVDAIASDQPLQGRPTVNLPTKAYRVRLPRQGGDSDGQGGLPFQRAVDAIAADQLLQGRPTVNLPTKAYRVRLPRQGGDSDEQGGLRT